MVVAFVGGAAVDALPLCLPQLMHLAERPGVARGDDAVPGLVDQEVMQQNESFAIIYDCPTLR